MQCESASYAQPDASPENTLVLPQEKIAHCINYNEYYLWERGDFRDTSFWLLAILLKFPSDALDFFRAKIASGYDQNIGKIAKSLKLVPREPPLSHVWTSWEGPNSFTSYETNILQHVSF